MPLSECLMTDSFLVPLNMRKGPKGISKDTWKNMAVPDRNEMLQNAQKEFRDVITAVKTCWTTNERAIIIQCGYWVTFWIVVCIVLVLGGLAIGFSVGTRINGEDPFNIPVFCWALAAFILVVVKSRRVEK